MGVAINGVCICGQDIKQMIMKDMAVIAKENGLHSFEQVSICLSLHKGQKASLVLYQRFHFEAS